MNQSKLEVNEREVQDAGKQLCESRLVHFGFISDWMTNWREFLSQSCNVVTHHQRNGKCVVGQSNENLSSYRRSVIPVPSTRETVFVTGKPKL